MNEETLRHYGVKGMKWGIIRTPEQLGHKKKTSSKTTTQKKTSNSKVSSTKTSKDAANAKPEKDKKSVSEMSDDELKRLIERRQLEKRYAELMAAPPKKEKYARGKKFVLDILESSGKNIGSQLVTYAMGKAVNKAFAGIFGDDQIVNPKKGQKDK